MMTLVGSVLVLTAFGHIAGTQSAASSEGCPNHLKGDRAVHLDVHNHTCYAFVDQEVYWSRAHSWCLHKGGDMLAVKDESTMQFIRNKLSSKEMAWDREGVWLGARDYHGTWRWTDNDPVTYTNWARGEPSSIFGSILSVEDCAQMRASDNWQWHDYPCGSLRFHYNFVCQFPLSHPGAVNGQIESSATDQEKDNGYAEILALVVGLSAGLILVMLIIFLLTFRHQRAKRKKLESAVHYTNSTYENAPHTNGQPTATTVTSVLSSTTNRTPENTPLPPVPTSRPPGIKDDDTYLVPGDVLETYEEVPKQQAPFHNLMFQPKPCKCTTTTPAKSEADNSSPCSSPQSSSSLGACGGGRFDPDLDLRTPLIPNPGDGKEIKANGTYHNCGTPPKTSAEAMADEGYMDMRSLSSNGSKPDISNGNAGGKDVSEKDACRKETSGKSEKSEKPDEDKHTYTNVDHREVAAENHYEVLP